MDSWMNLSISSNNSGKREGEKEGRNSEHFPRGLLKGWGGFGVLPLGRSVQVVAPPQLPHGGGLWVWKGEAGAPCVWKGPGVRNTGERRAGE